MLKILLSLVLAVQIFAFANDAEPQEENMMEPNYSECEIAFDKCIIKCDEDNEKYAGCYDACEESYQKCIAGDAQAK